MDVSQAVPNANEVPQKGGGSNLTTQRYFTYLAKHAYDRRQPNRLGAFNSRPGPSGVTRHGTWPQGQLPVLPYSTVLYLKVVGQRLYESYREITGISWTSLCAKDSCGALTQYAMLKFATFTSDIELPFYTSLASHKINHDKLDDSARRLLGLYEIRSSDSPEASCRLQIHGNALTNDVVQAGFCRAEGMIKNVNTIEEYRNLDKGAILSQAARTIWDAINDGTIYSCPSLLAFFTVICFADLKKYKFTYLFAFPALHSDPPWRLVRNTESRLGSEKDVLAEGDGIIHMTGEETAALVDSVQTWRYRVDARQHGFFLAKKCRTSSFVGCSGEVEAASDRAGLDDETNYRPITPETPGDKLGFAWTVGSLIDYERGFFENIPEEDRFVGFTDPSTYPSYPGWMLRNLLVLINRRWQLDKVQILCYRDIQAHRDEAKSIILSLMLEASDASISSAQSSSLLDNMPKVTGWERNSAGKVMSRIANLGEYMDPQRYLQKIHIPTTEQQLIAISRLADQAVDLNLKLIKWRIAPGLNLDKIKDTKCLLLGAGTLGSYVARNLMVCT